MDELPLASEINKIYMVGKLKRLINKINTHAAEGDRYVAFNNLSPELITKLKQAGYKVYKSWFRDCDGDVVFYIYWN